MLVIPYMGPVGVLAALVGAVIRWQVGKRRFRRRTLTGLEWFPTYTAAIVTKFLEAVAMLSANLLIFAGILLILAASV